MTRPGVLRRVVAVRSDSAGDVLLTGPAVRSLAAVAPVTLVCGPRGAEAGRLLPGVDDVVVYPCPWIDADRPPYDEVALAGLLDAVRHRRPDLAVVFTSARQSPLPMALALRMAGVARIAARSTDSPGSLVDHCLRTDDDVHEVERDLALVEAAGIAPCSDRRLAVRLDTSGPPLVADDGYVVVHPGASVPARTLDAARWTAVVQRLRDDGVTVVLTGTDSDTVTHDVRRSVRVSDDRDTRHRAPLVDLVGATPLAELAGVIARADAICVGNTGPMHLAAAVGTPVAAPFAPTVPITRWRPWLVDHELLGHHDVPCAHCRARTCPFDDHPCLAVDPADVVAAVHRLRRARRRSTPLDRYVAAGGAS